MALLYGWGSTASRLEPLQGGSLLFTTKFPEIPGTHFINLGRINGWVDLGAVVLIMGPLDWESSPLTTRRLLLIKDHNFKSKIWKKQKQKMSESVGFFKYNNNFRQTNTVNMKLFTHLWILQQTKECSSHTIHQIP